MQIKTTASSLATVALATALLSSAAGWARQPGRQPQSADARAEAAVKAMKPDEKTVLTHGVMPLPVGPNPPPLPVGAVPGAGFVPGIPRLGIPSLTETDASLGVSYVFGIRGDGATALPSGIAMASTWNPELLRKGGAMIGSQARAKGFNVLLAGGTNLMRDPRNGRTFEYLSEDPLLAGVLVGQAIAGIQSNAMISTIKHFALNGQETARKTVDVKISDAHARESDLLAFKIGIEQGNPGAVMCAYNRVNGEQACASDYLLNRVLKRDWRYKGFVMSDWGAVPGVEAAIRGLDQQSGSQLDKAVFFGEPLAEKAASDPAWAARLDDMNRRIVWAMFEHGLDTNRVAGGGKPDPVAGAKVAEETARQGIVLLRNRDAALPLARSAKSIAIIGGYADGGVLSGAGSSQVHGEGGAAYTVPVAGSGPFSAFVSQQFHRSSPLKAIAAMAPGAKVTFRDGRYVSEAVAQAKAADVVIVFATQWASEGFDQPDLSLPDGQDALIEAVAAANSNTIVVLETGGPVLMPWLDKTAAVIEAWYPGARGGEAIASILFGESNPSGRLPITFPSSATQLPRPQVDGFDRVEPDFAGESGTGMPIVADYDIEGSDVGYRWFARERLRPLFPFGFGLSYTSFEAGGLRTNGQVASVAVSNTGKRSGATVAQVYLVARGAEQKRRLVGFQRLDLAPGETRTARMTIDQRLLADWVGDRWEMPGGTYRFSVGKDAMDPGPTVSVQIAARSWHD